jgi:hypothetical protein
MENVASFHRRYAANASQILLVDDQPFPHTLPTNNTPYANNVSNATGAGYDGPGECLRRLTLTLALARARARSRARSRARARALVLARALTLTRRVPQARPRPRQATLPGASRRPVAALLAQGTHVHA